MTDYGLGRRLSPDPRDAKYPMRALLREEPVRNYRFWIFPHRQPLDQGATGTCVGHGWKHQLMAAPGVRQDETDDPNAITIYREATLNDEWPANDNGDLQFGTSVRAGAIALQRRGLITSYWWAQSLQDAVDHLLLRGPLVIGINWYEGMFNPSKEGIIRPAGSIAGGHCLLVIGANRSAGVVRLLNSWGPHWGQWGRCWMSFEDFERLLIAEEGEACATLELRRQP